LLTVNPTPTYHLAMLHNIKRTGVPVSKLKKFNLQGIVDEKFVVYLARIKKLYPDKTWEQMIPFIQEGEYFARHKLLFKTLGLEVYNIKMDLDALLLRPDKIISLRNNLPLNTEYPHLIDLIVEVKPIGN